VYATNVEEAVLETVRPNMQFDTALAKPFVAKGDKATISAERVDIAPTLTLLVAIQKTGHDKISVVSVTGPFYALYDPRMPPPHVVYDAIEAVVFELRFIFDASSRHYVRRAVHAIQVTAAMLEGTSGLLVQSFPHSVRRDRVFVGDWLVLEADGIIHVYKADVFALRFEPEIKD
jgi:hypothetical protein